MCNYSHCVISGGGALGDASMHQAGSMIVSRPAASNRKQTSHSVHFIAESVAVQYRGNMLSQGGTVLPPPRPPRPRTLRAASTSAITCDISSHGRVCHHPRQQPRPSHAWLEFSLAGLRARVPGVQVGQSALCTPLLPLRNTSCFQRLWRHRGALAFWEVRRCLKPAVGGERRGGTSRDYCPWGTS